MATIEIINFRSYEKNTLRGFLEIALPSGMCIRDLTVHEKDGSRWIAYPSKPYQDKDGNTKYMNQVYFPDKTVHSNFQKQVLGALDRYQAKGTSPETGKGDLPF